jgi:hypothetical protein
MKISSSTFVVLKPKVNLCTLFIIVVYLVRDQGEREIVQPTHYTSSFLDPKPTFRNKNGHQLETYFYIWYILFKIQSISSLSSCAHPVAPKNFERFFIVISQLNKRMSAAGKIVATLVIFSLLSVVLGVCNKACVKPKCHAGQYPTLSSGQCCPTCQRRGLECK